MNIHTLSDRVNVQRGFNTPITAATVNGTGVDTSGYEVALAILDTTPSGAGTTSDTKLQESDDNSTWVDVAGGVFTQSTTTALKLMNIQLSKRKRYLRLVHTGTGAAAAGNAAAVLVLGNARYNPTTQLNNAVTI